MTDQQQTPDPTASREAKDQAAEENADQVAQEAAKKQEALDSKEGSYAGGTPGGASESQQPLPDEEQESSGARFSGQGEVPDLDPETAAGVSARPAVAVNPGESYDDDLAGKPEDAEQE